MKRKKFAFTIFLLMVFTLIIPEAKASEIYYRNDNGVALTKEEYDFLSYMFWEGSHNY